MGGGHVISHLTINRPNSDYQALIGYANLASLKNIGLEKANISGASSVAGLVGYGWDTTLDGVWVNGSIAGAGNVAGLIGQADGGGSPGLISNSYSDGNVVASGTNAGGLAGWSNVPISHSYSTANVSGNSAVGGLIGRNWGATVDNTYASGLVTGTGTSPTFVGALIGDNTGSVTNSYWDSITSGQATSAAGTGLATGQLNQASYAGFDFTNTWWLSEGNTRPLLRSEYSTRIHNVHQLQLMALDLAASYTLAQDIDASATNGTMHPSGIWGNAGFVSIGDSETSFSGTFDGQHHTISHLTINRPAQSQVGLFGVVYAGVKISRVGLVGGSVTGGADVGALVGLNSGTLATTYSTATVTGAGDVGGLVGGNDGTVKNSYSTSSVSGSGSGYTGGLLGYNYGLVDSTYSSGLVTVTGTGTGAIGGLIGWEEGSATDVTNSFWNITTSGQTNSGGGTGLVAADMKATLNFTSATVANGNVNPAWDFAHTWVNYDGHTSPLLRSFMTPLTVTANSVSKTYDGLTSVATGVSYSAAPNANLLGSVAYSHVGKDVGEYTLSPSGLYSNQQGYLISYVDGTATVTAKTLALSATKTFDGTIDLTGAVTLVTGVGSETLTYSAASASDAHVSTTGKYISAITLGNAIDASGGLASNYQLPASLNASSAPVTISAANLSVALSNTGVTKVYDASTGAPGAFSPSYTFTGLVSGDTAATLSHSTAAYLGKDVATPSQALTLNGLTLSAITGNNSSATSDYALVNTSASVAASITPKPLTAGITGGGSVYGSAITSGTASLSGVIANDVVIPATVTVNTAGLLSTSGNLKAGTHSGIQSVSGVLTGADAGNYSFAGTTADYTVSQLALTGAAIAAVNTTYGTTAQPGAVSFGNVVSGDVVTSTAVIDNPLTSTSGKLKAASYSQTASTLSGTDAGNYSFTGLTTSTANYTVNQLALTGSITGGGSVYGSAITSGTASLGGVLSGTPAGSSTAVSDVVTPNTVTVSTANMPSSSSGNFKAGTYTAAQSVDTVLGGADAANYSFAGATADYTVSQLALTGVSGFNANKTYDGNTTASVNTTNAIFNGAISADQISVASASGTFADKNAGTAKAVHISGISLGGADASNYTLTNTSASNNADIAQLASVAWVATSPGNWSNPANWAGGAIPDLDNVAAVTIPSGANVTYDSAAGSTRLQSLDSNGSLTFAGGALDIVNALTATQFAQTAGTIAGAGSFTVNGRFSQAAGSIDMGGPVSITQTSGDLVVGNIRAAAIALNASNGAIGQTAALDTAGLLSTQSSLGTTLKHVGNRLGAFKASNSASGIISLINTGVFDIQGISTAAGSITVDNTGATRTSALVKAGGGDLIINAHSPLSIGAAGLQASGNISLSAANSDGDLRLDGPVSSSAGGISVSAGNNYTQNSAVQAALGVTASASGAMTFSATATTVGSPVSYTAAGVSAAPPPNSLVPSTPAPDQTIFVNTFDAQFAAALEAQNAVGITAPEPDAVSTVVADNSATDPLDKYRKKKDDVVVEGPTCKR